MTSETDRYILDIGALRNQKKRRKKKKKMKGMKKMAKGHEYEFL